MAEKPKSDDQKNVGGAQRRTWDIGEYEKRARDRAELGDATVEGDVDSRPLRDREEFKKASSDMVGPAGSARAYVKHREKNLNLASAIGKTQLITDSGLRQKGGGWFCDVCDCLLKDSANYLDHINGKKHQRALGYSMRVERSTVEQVQSRLGELTKRKAEEEAGHTGPTAEEAYAQRLRQVAEDEERRKRQRKDAKKAKKAETEALELEGMDPEMMEAMGFGSFGGGGAKR